MEPARHLDITANKKDYNADVDKILAEIRPNWKKESIEIKPLSGGTVNVILRVVHGGDLSDGLIIRINGEVSDLIGMSREQEMKFTRLLNENGLGVPLIASFNNGIVSKLVSGQLFDEQRVDLLVDQKFTKKFTKMLAQMHHVTPKDVQPLTKENYRFLIFVRTSIDSIRKIKNHERLEKFFKDVITLDEMEKEAHFVFDEAQKLNMPICLSHNDLWHNNMLYEKDTDMLHIIDYETMDINYRPFDLATYLLLLLKAHLVPGLPSPSHVAPDFVPFFIRSYLEAVAELEGKPASSVTDEDVQKYQKWIKMCELVYLWLYIPLMIYLTYYQQQYGDDMDCVGLAEIWIKAYREMKAEYKF